MTGLSTERRVNRGTALNTDEPKYRRSTHMETAQ